INLQIRDQAVQAILESFGPEFVAHFLGVSKKSIKQWVENFKLFGDANPPTFHPGRPCILSSELIGEITDRIVEYLDNYLDKMQEWLALYHNMKISKSALSLNILELNLSWKKVRRIARNQVDQECAEWFHQFLCEFHPLHLVFLDKTSKDDHTLIFQYR
ncbi:hypothetical protein BDV98DRAFT_518183, partial [Pterulicium gracile]